jgi:hypothetical protein
MRDCSQDPRERASGAVDRGMTRRRAVRAFGGPLTTTLECRLKRCREEGSAPKRRPGMPPVEEQGISAYNGTGGKGCRRR